VGQPGVGLRGALAARFKASDLNRDGVISRDEVVRLQTARFLQIDYNGDGGVDLAEFSAMPTAARGAVDPKAWLKSRRFQFTRIDSNADGRITLPEFEATAVQVFAASDVDNDGRVTPEELVLSITQMTAQVQMRHAMRGLDAADSDGDGAIDEAEFAGAQAAQFARMDADRGGDLTADEYAQALGPRPPVTFDSLDVDRDARVGRAEFSAAGNALFRSMDLDGDGRLTPDEVARGAQ